MSWTAKRETERKEDKAYSLLGTFNVYMPLTHGEGDNAFSRLEEEIEKTLKPYGPPSPALYIKKYDFIIRYIFCVLSLDSYICMILL